MDPGFNIAEFRAKHLKDTNECRKKHAAEPLVLCEELNKFAQEWADTIASTGQLYHRSESKYGENIAAAYSLADVNAVKNWYAEEAKYKYDVGKFSNETGYFTQLVWRNSKRLGVGVAKSASGVYYVVANYDPPGNFVGAFVQNVGTKRK
ncbi:hypothetical protein L596_011366 [Steinernema carpocapsae]|uniref:SCP domain-containing protein n=1 Tax=Steinernema carpocapsae TaxID=34508 RepID=A0A4U5NTN2_STECR|nr:hypothetical protein L596_011366 [Steinernema carpocapsae]